MGDLAQSPLLSSDEAVLTADCDDVSSVRDRIPVIGVFWDIENCQVPRGRSAAVVAQAIRDKFFAHHREVEFLVVCDVTKENPKIIEELNCAKVNVTHVAATSKNAADDKLRQRIRQFGETYPPGSTLVLITGDINFSAELIEIRHQRMMRVILLHNQNTSDGLIICANAHYLFHELIENIPDKDESNEDSNHSVDLWIHNLPESESSAQIKMRLKQLCSNCGGRVYCHSRNLYFVRFPSLQLATRAQRRMDGQDVFGHRIAVSEPRGFDWSRTPGRNRPKKQEELLKPWDTLLDVNTHTPQPDSKVAGIENLRHFDQQQEQLQNNLRKAGVQAAASANLVGRLNNPCDAKSKNEYCTDSSSGPCDDDSDGESSGLSNESGPVDLRITGLDPHQDLHITRVQLSDAVNQYAKIMKLSVYAQRDGSTVATVQLKCLADAQLVIANLQRFRFGNHRIKISFHNTKPEQQQLTRRQVSEMLSKFPETKIPLFRFKELYKSEYLTSVSVSELRRMRDICIISEDNGGRTISANPWSRGSPFVQSSLGDWQEGPYCKLHYRSRPGFVGKPPGLPNVRIRLGLIADRVHNLLQMHKGRLPLASLDYCYTSRFGPMPVSQEDGVALEHLVACLPGVEIVQTQACHKFLVSATTVEKPADKARVYSNGSLASQLVELLKTTPRATLSFASFIPAYHRRFGRQFRLSDYGHTKLLDLLESMPHVVQVMGFGSERWVTLSHKSQIKRFKIEFMKVLKTLSKKSIELSTFPPLYNQLFSRPFEPWQYGLCELEDLINCCVGTDLKLTCLENGRLVVSITTREQTAEELALTTKFKAEVVELLKHNPDCSMLFNKFVPAYHNYFGKQCRVVTYGFQKLIDLFEAITDTVTIEESAASDQKYLVLTLSERLKALGERVNTVANAHGSIMLDDLEHAYQIFQYGVIDPFQYECASLIQLIGLLSDYVKVVASPHGYLLQPVPLLDTIVLDLRTRCLLLSRDRLSVDAFRAFYIATFPGSDLNVDLAMSRIPQTARITVVDNVRFVQLTPRAIFANQVYTLLFEEGGCIVLVNFEHLFNHRFGSTVRPTELGTSDLSGLLTSFPETFIVVKNQQPTENILQLNPTIKESGFSLPSSAHSLYSLWSSQLILPGWDDIVKPPSASCLPIPDTLLTKKRKLTG